MNKGIDQEYRRRIKKGLSQLSPKQIGVFKAMYGHKNRDYSYQTIVDHMPQEKLDWALEQVERTLHKMEIHPDYYSTEDSEEKQALKR